MCHATLTLNSLWQRRHQDDIHTRHPSVLRRVLCQEQKSSSTASSKMGSVATDGQAVCTFRPTTRLARQRQNGRALEPVMDLVMRCPGSRLCECNRRTAQSKTLSWNWSRPGTLKAIGVSGVRRCSKEGLQLALRRTVSTMSEGARLSPLFRCERPVAPRGWGVGHAPSVQTPYR